MVVITDNLSGKTTNNLNLSLSDIMVITNSGEEILVNSLSDSIKVIDNSAGIKKATNQNNIKLNFTDQQLIINSSSAAIKKIAIYDILGKELFVESYNTKYITISRGNFTTNRIYFIEISTDEGIKTYPLTIVK